MTGGLAQHQSEGCGRGVHRRGGAQRYLISGCVPVNRVLLSTNGQR